MAITAIGNSRENAPANQSSETDKRLLAQAQRVLLSSDSSVSEVMSFIEGIDAKDLSPNMQTAIQLLLSERDLRTQFMSNVIERMFRTSDVIANNI